MKLVYIVNIVSIILMSLFSASCPHRYDYDNFYYGSPPSTIRPDVRNEPMFRDLGPW